jgi:protein tyrosine/serine phosphatase
MKLSALKRLLLLLLLGIGAAAAYVLYIIACDNFHVVSVGQVYRSGQMSAGTLAGVIREHGIRTVLNFRGASPKQAWYSVETNVTHQLGVQHLDFALSAGREVSEQEIETILDSIQRAPKPILIHCNGGADRTGLISALYLYTVEGKPSDVADRELTAFYGHIPYLHWRNSVAMDYSFWRYVSNETAKAKRKVQFVPGDP